MPVESHLACGLDILALWSLIDSLPLVLLNLDTNTRNFVITKVTTYSGGQLSICSGHSAHLEVSFEAVFGYLLEIFTYFSTFGPVMNLLLLGFFL